MDGRENAGTLRVSEIFHSIQGETSWAGFPSVFIRLAGCNLRCSWCDTAYARDGGSLLSIESILRKVDDCRGFHHITLTGGEPLMQEGTIGLLKSLSMEHPRIQIETNGSLSLAGIPPGVRKITDVKTPSSGEEGSFLMENCAYLSEADEIKFVIADERDYIYSMEFIEKNLAKSNGVINFSPLYGKMPDDVLAEWILESGKTLRINLQLHKILWPGGEPGTGGKP